ncbi:hypothetical protein SEA_CECE_311 [Microbacterium phage Cece]|nr:hypothetical protein SEA_CECE_9 [Microbacterium phage Cece]UVG35317.1 hypothetical protein SEA_CECE_311 [Microbacterium phage Cece]
MSTHVELHFCHTARDAAALEKAGLPRYDLEPTRCGNCNARCGELHGDDAVTWRPLAVVVWETGVSVLCGRCLKCVEKILSA